MRASAAAFLSLFALASTAIPGHAADPGGWSPAGPYTFVQGQTYELSFVQPPLDNFLGYDLYIRYSPAVYEPLGFEEGELGAYLSIPNPAPPYAPSDAPTLNEVLIQASPTGVFPADGLDVPAGTAFTVSFKVKVLADDVQLPPGAGDVSVVYNLFIDPTVNEEPLVGQLLLSPTIAAVPEPTTWATMLAGLALIGAAAARKRRHVSSIAV